MPPLSSNVRPLNTLFETRSTTSKHQLKLNARSKMKMKQKRVFYVAGIALLIGNLHTAQANSETSQTPEDKMPNALNASRNWVVRKEIGSAPSSIQICLKKTGKKWTQMQNCDLSESGSESISLNPWKQEITLIAEPPKKISQIGSSDPINGWECYRGALGTSFRSQSEYSICSSEFRKNIAGAAEMVIGNLFNVALGTVRTTVVVDADSLLQAAIESGALATANEWKKSVELDTYRNQFSAASTSAQLDGLIENYKNNDPDNLIPAAIIRRDKLRDQEAQNQMLADARRAEQRKQRESYLREQQKQEEELQRQAEKRRNEAMRSIIAFRKSIKIETQTNCGPVLETKGQLVKIYFPLSNYGNEHWVNKNSLFPSHYACSFYNGRYQPPSP